MTSAIYSRLRERLDQYALGFSTTESGVELRILQKLFTEEEAEMYLNLSGGLVVPPERGDFMRPSSEIEGSIAKAD